MFGGDPFGNPFAHMQHQMQAMDNMMNAMMGDTFGMLNNDPFGMLGPRSHQQQQMIANGASGTRARNDMMLHPFGGGLLGGGGIFGGLMQHMNNLQSHALNDPHSTVFSEATMVSFDGQGQPKVVQSSTRKAGDAKETRRTVQRGADLSELSVGHSIGDRSHVIEKKRDKTGKFRQQQRFVNLDEDGAEDFNNEFKSHANHHLHSSFGFIPGGSNGHGDRRSIKINAHNYGKKDAGRPEIQQGPIVTVPDDDDDDIDVVYQRKGGRTKNRSDDVEENYVRSNTGSNPTIREITDEEEESEIPKRRKGFLGRFNGGRSQQS